MRPVSRQHALAPLRLINISYRERAAYCDSAFAGLYVYALLAHERHLTGHYCQRQGSLTPVNSGLAACKARFHTEVGQPNPLNYFIYLINCSALGRICALDRAVRS